MKKRIISLLLAVMMLAGMMSVSAFAADTYGTKGVISLSADKTEVYVGDTVTVTVAISSNPGLAGLELVLKADGLTIGEIKQLDFAGNWETGANGVVWAFEDAGENTTATGNFAEVTFTAAAEGTYTIGVEKAEGGIIDEGTEKYVAFEDVAPLTIKVEKRPYTLGDVDDTGEVDVFDALAVLEYSIDESYADNNTFIKEAADVDGVEGIDIFDAVAILEMAIG